MIFSRVEDALMCAISRPIYIFGTWFLIDTEYHLIVFRCSNVCDFVYEVLKKRERKETHIGCV